MEKLYAAGAGLLVGERGGHTALHLACRVGAPACARALLQPRPREAPYTYLTQSRDHTPETCHTPATLHPEAELEEEESEEDWKQQLEAENYEGEGWERTPAPRQGWAPIGLSTWLWAQSLSNSKPSPLENQPWASRTLVSGSRISTQTPDN